MSPTPAAFLVTGPPDYWRAVRSMDRAVPLKEARPELHVEALITWTDCGRAMRELRDELAEAKTLLAAMAAELALLRQRARAGL